jgi:hypothetical protein
LKLLKLLLDELEMAEKLWLELADDDAEFICWSL